MGIEDRLDRLERLIVLLINEPPELLIKDKMDQYTELGSLYQDLVADHFAVR